MANFGENPFGESESTNPFGEIPAQPVRAVPAASSSVSPSFMPAVPPVSIPYQPRSTTMPANEFSSSLNFYEDNTNARPQAYGAMASSPIAPQLHIDNSPKLNTDDLRRRQEELERKAAELDRREAEIRNSPYNPKRNNFPPLPEKCCFGPCFYQDFEVDIPLGFKSLVKTFFYLWLVYTTLLLLNLIASIAYLCVVGGTSAATTFGLSILWIVLFPGLSFIGWYRPSYKAFRSDSSLSFFVFFLNFGAQIGVSIIQALGIDQCGTCGIINGLGRITIGGMNNVGVGAFMLIIGVLFAIFAGASFLMFVRVHRIYRSTGASFKKAQKEFATRAVNNEHVQNAAVSAAQNPHVQDAVFGAAQRSVQGTSGRF